MKYQVALEPRRAPDPNIHSIAVIKGDSMEETLHSGDLVFARFMGLILSAEQSEVQKIGE
jgi:hypothetical protein